MKDSRDVGGRWLAKEAPDSDIYRRLVTAAGVENIVPDDGEADHGDFKKTGVHEYRFQGNLYLVYVVYAIDRDYTDGRVICLSCAERVRSLTSNEDQL